MPITFQPIEAKIQQDLRSFIGQTIFEELGHLCIWEKAKAGDLSFFPEQVGRHWSRGVQIDLAATNWAERGLLIGECKWGGDPVDRGTVRELVEKRLPKVLGRMKVFDVDWSISLLFLSRSGYTDSAKKYAIEKGIQLLDLNDLMKTLDSQIADIHEMG